MELNRAWLLASTVAVGFLLPSVIPQIGLDYVYFFITVIVLLAWFMIKWESVKAITAKSTVPEMAIGLSLIVADYAFNAARSSTMGILDLIIVLLGSVVFVYGVKSMKLFWVPVAYGVVLLVGYQIENYTPNFVALQDWLAGVMASAMNALGTGAVATGHYVSMSLPNGTPLLLDVSSDCTGIQGILAFGMLSTMTLLDFKPRISRAIPLFAVGFLGAFLINIVRLLVVFLTFEFLGSGAGETMHVYFGYLIFITWVLAFWYIAFRYVAPARGALPQQAAMTTPLVK